MTSRSWVEILGRHAAAAATYMSATMCLTDGRGNVVHRLDFWHGPQEQWRIEVEGSLVYLRDRNGTRVLKSEDGEMYRQDGDFGVDILGPLSPLDLVGPGSLPYQMSASAEMAGVPARTVVDSRPAWAVTFGSDAGPVEFAFDDELGMLVRVHNPATNATVELADLQSYDSLPGDLFTWNGPDIPASSHPPIDRR